MIQITEEQRKALHKLWFIYGNNGKKHTHQNHRFIQNFLENGEDTRKFYLNAKARDSHLAATDFFSNRLTQECIDEVDKILSNPRHPGPVAL